MNDGYGRTILMQVRGMKTALRQRMIGSDMGMTSSEYPRFNRTLFLAIGIVMSALIPNQSSADDHIQIVREVVVESGRSAMPVALAPTKHGGALVIGSFSDWTPWVSRVDAEGNVQWRHTIDMGQAQPGVHAGYTSAAGLADDSTVACGYRDVGRGKVAGILTHIDPTGKIISHQQLSPRAEPPFPLVYFSRCLAWGNGAVVIGEATRFRPPDPNHREVDNSDKFFWLIRVDAKGDVQWEKLIPDSDKNSYLNIRAITLANQELILMPHAYQADSVPPQGRRLIRIGPQGDVLGDRFVPGQQVLVRPATAESVVRLVPESVRNGSMWTVSGDLGSAEGLEGKADWIVVRAASRSSNGSLVLAGDLQGSYTASIAWLDAGLSETQTLQFGPQSGWIADVMPADMPNEFVTVRARSPSQGGGAVLTYVKIK